MSTHDQRIGVSLPGPFWVSWRSQGLFVKVFLFIIVCALVYVALWIALALWLIIGLVGTGIVIVHKLRHLPAPHPLWHYWLIVPAYLGRCAHRAWQVWIGTAPIE